LAAEKQPNDSATRALGDARDRALVREARRLYERYAVEVVEHFDLCPWAARARREGATEPRVLLQRGPCANFPTPDDLAPSLAAIDELVKKPSIAIGLFVYPRLAVNRLDFEHFLRKLRRADSERHAIGEIPFAMAAFHPDAPADLADPDRLIPFIRRTPDPTLQLVRRDALESVQARPNGTAFADLWMISPRGLHHETGPSPRERVALRNFETVQRVGVAAIEARMLDIARDREETYARIAVMCEE
jgi:hypothetical protein